MMYSNGTKCCLATCSSIFFEKKQTGTKFHRFPKDHSRCAVWIEYCKPINLPTIDPDILIRKHRLCSLHFEDKMYINFEKTSLSNQAIPTIFKNNNFVPEDQTSQPIEIPSECFDESIIPTESTIIDNPSRSLTPVNTSVSPNKERETFRYIGDFSDDDLRTPKTRKMFWVTYQRTVKTKNNKIKKLQQIIHKYEVKLKNLKYLIELQNQTNLLANDSYQVSELNNGFNLTPEELLHDHTYCTPT